MKPRDWNPADGLAFQGDVLLMPIPDTIPLRTTDEIAPIDGRLILQEGEVTGHHHAIRLPQPVMFRDDGIARDPAVKAPVAIGVAHLYRDDQAARAMVAAGLLARSDLCTGFLVVEGGPVTVSHEEHDPIHLPPGRYYVGQQIESAGAEERVVSD